MVHYDEAAAGIARRIIGRPENGTVNFVYVFKNVRMLPDMVT